MSIQLPNQNGSNLASLQTGQSGVITCTVAMRPGSIPGTTSGRKYPQVVLNNESGSGLAINFRGSNRQITMPAGAWTLPMDLLDTDVAIDYTVLYVLPNAPVAKLFCTIYGPTEKPLQIAALGNSPIGISGGVTTSNGSGIANDGSAPGTVIIESTPSDQSQSSFNLKNDGSGLWQVLSTNVLRHILNIVRGTTTTEAVVDIGDTNDLSMTTYHGKFDAAVTFPATQISGNLPTSQLSGTINPATQIGSGTLPAGVHETQINSDAGTLTSDGSGNLTGVSFLNAETSITPNADAANHSGIIFDLAAINGETVKSIYLIHKNGGGSPSVDGHYNNSTPGWLYFDMQNASIIFHNNGAVQPGNGGTILGASLVSGSGSATVNHGQSGTPDIALVNNKAGSSSSTMGSGSYNGTSVFVYQFSAMAWAGMVYAR